jgi:hypothetical protein
MNNEQTVDSGSHGIRWGLIIGGVYLVLLFLRYYVGATSFIAFSGLTFVGFISVVIMLLVSGFQLRKKNGGWIEMKEAFKAMFISVLIIEFIYLIFTFVYLKYVDPTFFDKLRISTEELLLATKQSQSDVDAAVKNIDLMKEQSLNMGVFDFLRSYLTYVGIMGLFALLFAFIIKRKPPVFEQDQFNQSSY